MTSQLPSRRFVVSGALASFVLAGCSSTSGSSSSKGGGSQKASSRLKEAHDTLAKTSGYHIKMTSKLPSNFSEAGIDNGEGDVTNKPAGFKGKVKVEYSGSGIDADVVSLDSGTWVKTGLSSGYQSFDLKKFKIPQPSQLLSASKGLPSLLLKCNDAKESGKKLAGGQQVTIIKGTIDAMTATRNIGFGRDRSDYTLEAGLDDQNRLVTMTLTGPFYDSGNASYTLDISKYDQKVSITKPV